MLLPPVAPTGYNFTMPNATTVQPDATALRALRAGRGLSQTEVATALERTQAWVSQIESGNYTTSKSSLRLIALFYGVQPETLIVPAAA